MVHFDGSAWSVQPGITRHHLKTVWVGGAGDVWVAGDNATILRRR